MQLGLTATPKRKDNVDTYAYFGEPVYVYSLSARFNRKQQAFLDFVLSHYVSEGVRELDQEKLTPLLRLKYNNSIADAVADLGKPEEIGDVFCGFQKYLYQRAVDPPPSLRL